MVVDGINAEAVVAVVVVGSVVEGWITSSPGSWAAAGT